MNLTQFVQISHDQVTTTSEHIATAFNKQHKNVLQKIDEIIADIPTDFARENFKEITVSKTSNLGVGTIQSRAYELSKDGFMLLVMGFTGKIAMQIKIAYIQAFNAMAEQLSGSLKAIPQSQTSVSDRAPLRNAVIALAHKKGVDYSSAYNIVHQRFGVAHIDELPIEMLDQAVQYIHALTIDKSITGEVLDKISGSLLPQVYQDNPPLNDLKTVLKYITYLQAYILTTHRLVEYLRPEIATPARTFAHEISIFAERLACHYRLPFTDFCDLWRSPSVLEQQPDWVKLCLKGFNAA